MQQIDTNKIMDKIECEIKTAKGFKIKMEKYLTVKQMGIFEGKIQALKDLKSWVENSKRDKRLTGIIDGYEQHLRQGVFPKNLEKDHNGKRS